MKHDTIAVIDFGGQYAHLIATKVRRNHILAEIRQPEDSIEKFEKYKGIIMSGSPALSSQGEDSAYTKAIFDLDIPILGFCFGHQEIAKHYGGKVIHGGREWGHADMHIVKEHALFKNLDKIQHVWMSHFDSVTKIGPDFEELGYSLLGDTDEKHHYAAIGSDKLRRYGFQYHPEVDNTEHGEEMIANFVIEICKCQTSWTMESYVEQQMNEIKKQVGDNSVFLLASGGVDSTVAAKLFGDAIGSDRLHLLHVDNGLMRKNESANVIKMYEALGLKKNLHFVDATDRFLGDLGEKTEPEKKRYSIGQTFIDVFESEAKRLGIEGHLLGQGTIYPDTIETGGTKRADTIKTHHNRVPIIEQMILAGKVIEPLKDLYKTEVRELGEKINLPKNVIWRHPFPGPGLGVRLLCSDGTETLDDFEKIQTQVSGAVKKYGLTALPLPVKSVGVKADIRSYEHPVIFSGQASWKTLQEASGLVFKNVMGINRCIWNIANTETKTAKLLKATMTKERLNILRDADYLVMQGLEKYNLYDEIWQCPTVLIPMEINGKGKEFCVIRPILSERAMTATAACLPQKLIAELQKSIMALPTISGLAIDLTSKPPGTIEWE